MYILRPLEKLLKAKKCRLVRLVVDMFYHKGRTPLYCKYVGIHMTRELVRVGCHGATVPPYYKAR